MANEKRGDGTVGKALDVLSEVAEIGSPVRFSSLLKTSKYPKATLYRLLQTLLNQDMLSYNEEEQTYKLGLKLVRMAHSAWLQSSLAPVAVPFIDDLSEKLEKLFIWQSLTMAKSYTLTNGTQPPLSRCIRKPVKLDLPTALELVRR